MPATVGDPLSQSVRAIIMSTFIKSWGVGRGRSVPLSALTTSITSGWRKSWRPRGCENFTHVCLIITQIGKLQKGLVPVQVSYTFLLRNSLCFHATSPSNDTGQLRSSLGKPPGESVTGSTLRGHNPRRRRWRRRARLDGGRVAAAGSEFQWTPAGMAATREECDVSV